MSELVPIYSPQASKSPPDSPNRAALSHQDDHSEELSQSKRGKKPFIVSKSVERGIVRIIDYTNVSFDQLAKAVEQAKGPGCVIASSQASSK